MSIALVRLAYCRSSGGLGLGDEAGGSDACRIQSSGCGGSWLGSGSKCTGQCRNSWKESNTTILSHLSIAA